MSERAGKGVHMTGNADTERARGTVTGANSPSPNLTGPTSPANQKGVSNMDNEAQRDQPAESERPEDRPEEPGAEGGSKSPSADKIPSAPADDDSPLGDSDQHSDA